MPRRKDKKYCFYCNAVVTFGSSPGDHFPIPKRHGGTETVNCCLSCHDMKDRIGLQDWHLEWIQNIENDLPNVSRETKLFLSKVVGVLLDQDIDGKLKNGAGTLF